MQEQSLIALLEAMLFAAARPVTVKELSAAAELSEANTELALAELKRQVNNSCRGVLLREVAGGLQFLPVLNTVSISSACFNLPKSLA